MEDAEKADEGTAWHAWLVAVEGADGDAPVSVAYRATPEDAPIHVGCTSRLPPCPFMGDFVTMAALPDGTPYVVFPDTCNEGCEGKADATAEDIGAPFATVVGLHGWSLRPGGA